MVRSSPTSLFFLGVSCAAAAAISLACDGPRNPSGSTEPPQSANSQPALPRTAEHAQGSSPPRKAKEEPSEELAAPLGRHWTTQLPHGTQQLVVVTSQSWAATDGELRRYALFDSAWRQAGATARVVLGKSGLGWGRGLHAAEATGAQKREGDGKAPAGLFLLNKSYGHGPGARLQTGLEHTSVTPSWRCVDDVKSTHYGELLDAASVNQDWKSAEKLQRSDPLYEIIVLVEHNGAHERGAGSCIFLHTWRFLEDQPSVPRPTVGCTAMARESLLVLVEWLKPGAVLAQLPAAEVKRD
ncbi:MAG: L,D-transpeptidase [Polyangiaceae bacterium]